MLNQSLRHTVYIVVDLAPTVMPVELCKLTVGAATVFPAIGKRLTKVLVTVDS